MPNLEPTYLRYVYDALNKGSLNAENAAALPRGFIGLYEQEFTQKTPAGERKKVLNQLALWALFKGSVSANMAAAVLELEEEQMKDLVDTYSSWFNSPESGKYQLYHERLKLYLLQKLKAEEVQVLNEKLISFLEDAIKQANGEEDEYYALEHLHQHMALESQLGNHYDRLHSYVNQESLWRRQIQLSKGYAWSQNAVQQGIKEGARRNYEMNTIRSTVNSVKLMTQEQNSAEDILNLLNEGDYLTALKRAETWEGERQFKLYLLFIHELTIGTSSEADFRKEACKAVLEAIDQTPEDHSVLDWCTFYSKELIFQYSEKIKNLNIEIIWKRTKIKLDTSNFSNEVNLLEKIVNSNNENRLNNLPYLYKKKFSKTDTEFKKALEFFETNHLKLTYDSKLNLEYLELFCHYNNPLYKDVLEIILKKIIDEIDLQRQEGLYSVDCDVLFEFYNLSKSLLKYNNLNDVILLLPLINLINTYNYEIECDMVDVFELKNNTIFECIEYLIKKYLNSKSKVNVSKINDVFNNSLLIEENIKFLGNFGEYIECENQEIYNQVNLEYKKNHDFIKLRLEEKLKYNNNQKLLIEWEKEFYTKNKQIIGHEKFSPQILFNESINSLVVDSSYNLKNIYSDEDLKFIQVQINNELFQNIIKITEIDDQIFAIEKLSINNESKDTLLIKILDEILLKFNKINDVDSYILKCIQKINNSYSKQTSQNKIIQYLVENDRTELFDKYIEMFFNLTFPKNENKKYINENSRYDTNPITLIVDYYLKNKLFENAFTKISQYNLFLSLEKIGLIIEHLSDKTLLLDFCDYHFNRLKNNSTELDELESFLKHLNKFNHLDICFHILNDVVSENSSFKFSVENLIFEIYFDLFVTTVKQNKHHEIKIKCFEYLKNNFNSRRFLSKVVESDTNQKEIIYNSFDSEFSQTKINTNSFLHTESSGFHSNESKQFKLLFVNYLMIRNEEKKIIDILNVFQKNIFLLDILEYLSINQENNTLEIHRYFNVVDDHINKLKLDDDSLEKYYSLIIEYNFKNKGLQYIFDIHKTVKFPLLFIILFVRYLIKSEINIFINSFTEIEKLVLQFGDSENESLKSKYKVDFFYSILENLRYDIVEKYYNNKDLEKIIIKCYKYCNDNFDEKRYNLKQYLSEYYFYFSLYFKSIKIDEAFNQLVNQIDSTTFSSEKFSLIKTLLDRLLLDLRFVKLLDKNTENLIPLAKTKIIEKLVNENFNYLKSLAFYYLTKTDNIESLNWFVNLSLLFFTNSRQREFSELFNEFKQLSPSFFRSYFEDKLVDVFIEKKSINDFQFFLETVDDKNVKKIFYESMCKKFTIDEITLSILNFRKNSWFLNSSDLIGKKVFLQNFSNDIKNSFLFNLNKQSETQVHFLFHQAKMACFFEKQRNEEKLDMLSEVLDIKDWRRMSASA
tara:strand:- start:564 stop:4826 length:4263 start_codon:yes stop_codon:yes gene_type:complete